MKETEFDVVIDQCLCKSTTILTECKQELDDEGYSFYDTSDIDFKDEYERQRMTPLQLINKLKEVLTKHPNLVPNQKWLIQECEGWEDIETTVIEG